MTENICPLCKSAKNKLLLKKDYKNRIFSLLNCNNCYFVFLAPRLTQEENDSLYDDDYFKGQGFDRTVNYVKEYESEFDPEYSRILDKINRYSKTGKLLDIGPGMGNLMDEAKKDNWDVYGLEVSEFAAKKLNDRFRGKVKRSSIKSGLFPDNYFDAVTMMEVIEHLTDPVESLKVISGYLKKEGILLIQTGNIRSLKAFIKGKSWNYILIPGHINYYSFKTMKETLKLSGFKVKRIYPPNDIEGGRLYGWIDRILKNNNFIKRAVIGIYKIISGIKEYLISDGMIVIAEKI